MKNNSSKSEILVISTKKKTDKIIIDVLENGEKKLLNLKIGLKF